MIKDYILGQLFFPEVITIDEPGIIINRTSFKYSTKKKLRRTMYQFADNFLAIQKRSDEKLGKLSDKLFYECGKEVGLLYLSSTPKILKSSIVDFIYDTLAASGLSIASNIEYDEKGRKIKLKAKESTLCDDNPSFLAGIVSGIQTRIEGRNIEAKGKCGGVCIIKASPVRGEYKDVTLDSDDRNFPAKTKKYFAASFSDLMRFKKITIDEHGRHYYMDKLIVPSLPEIGGILVKNFEDAGKKDFLRKITVEETQKYFPNDKKEIENMMSAFGWGIPFFDKKEVRFIYPPFSQYGFEFQAWQTNAAMNIIRGKKLKLSEIKESPESVKFTYTEA